MARMETVTTLVDAQIVPVAGDSEYGQCGITIENLRTVLNTTVDSRVSALEASMPTQKRYVALLTQSSTNAPTAVVLENTLGGTLVWTYNSAGSYFGTLAGVFTADKVHCQLSVADPVGGYGAASRVDADKIVVQTTNTGVVSNIGTTTNNVLPALTNGILNKASLTVIVYS